MKKTTLTLSFLLFVTVIFLAGSVVAVDRVWSGKYGSSIVSLNPPPASPLGGGEPDLTVGGVRIESISNFSQSDYDVEIVINVSNIGSATADESTTKLSLMSTAVFPSIGSFFIETPSLGSGESVELTQIVTLPEGLYVAVAFADDLKNITESNEFNNVGFTRFTVP